MAYQYVTVNGQRVETHVQAAFQRLRAAFTARWGLDLMVSSGTRTRAEQQALYSAYRAGRGNLAAAPGQSNHEEDGPRGPRALDVRDSGADAGVTVVGTARSNWLRDNAGAHGFNHAGLGFHPAEAWHIEFTGELVDGVTTAGGVTAAVPAQVVEDRQNWLNSARGEHLTVDGINGPATAAAIARYQRFLGVTADGEWGPVTQAAHAVYYAKVTAPTPSTTASFGRVDVVQRALKTKYPLYASRLAVDNIDGPATIAAVKEFQRRAGLTIDGIAGPATRRALGL